MSPTILESASMDHSVRLWSLDPKYEKQPCMLICAGEGHKEGLLTLVSGANGSPERRFSELIQQLGFPLYRSVPTYRRHGLCGQSLDHTRAPRQR